MTFLPRLLVAAFLLIHGLIHAAYVSPRPPATAGGPPWPFELGRSWVLTPLSVEPRILRSLGLALFAATFIGSAAAALATLGVLSADLWAPAAALGAIASAALLVLFFHPWLIVGLLIDLAILWAVVVARWSPSL